MLVLPRQRDPSSQMADNRTFSKATLAELDTAKIIGVCAGEEHKYTGVWVVVVDGRVFARSWFDKPTGWFRAFKEEPLGWIEVGDKEVRVRGRVLRSQRLRDAVTEAYREKYNTKANQKWLTGFAEPQRAANTMEFVPRTA
jgi:hypothetical protein